MRTAARDNLTVSTSHRFAICSLSSAVVREMIERKERERETGHFAALILIAGAICESFVPCVGIDYMRSHFQ